MRWRTEVMVVICMYGESMMGLGGESKFGWMEGGVFLACLIDAGNKETRRQTGHPRTREGKDGMGPGRNTRRSRCKRFTDLESSTRQDKTRQDDGRNQGSAEGEEKNDDDVMNDKQ